MRSVGKRIGDRCYIHVSVLKDLSTDTIELIGRSLEILGISVSQVNVIRVHDNSIIAFLNYEDFYNSPFPKLIESWRTDLRTNKSSYRDFRQSINRPILHRKELLIAKDNEQIKKFQKLTEDLELIGAFENTKIIGFEKQWFTLLTKLGYYVENHQLLPIGNKILNECVIPNDASNDINIQRHLTALKRQTPSAPIAALCRLNLISEETSLFDYGCGYGDDIKYLRENNVEASGWDPFYAPENEFKVADIVNLGFVINVIENAKEREDVLLHAFSLARRGLCVSVMLENSSRMGSSFNDGIITKRNTFQKYYTQPELVKFVGSILYVTPFSVAPGIIFAPKDNFISDKIQFSRSSGIRRPSSARSAMKANISSREKQKFDAKEILRPVISEWEQSGEMPDFKKFENSNLFIKAFRSYKNAALECERLVDKNLVFQTKSRNKNKILVTLAISRFKGTRLIFRDLSEKFKKEIKLYYSNLENAYSAADELIEAMRDREKVRFYCYESEQNGFGKIINSELFCIHIELLDQLPSTLQLLIESAKLLLVDNIEYNILYIDFSNIAIIFLSLENADSLLPTYKERIFVNLRRQSIQRRKYNYMEFAFYGLSNYMHQSMPTYLKQAEFDNELAKYIQFGVSGIGPKFELLRATLKSKLLEIGPDGILEMSTHPKLDDPCGRFLKYRDLIQAGETFAISGISNLPKNIESYKALLFLAENILDPVIEWYGSIEISYGFCSDELRKKITYRVAPKLDQHCSFERTGSGVFICERTGAAVDFFVKDENMYEVANWVMKNTKFDRLYFYGSDRPIHVSHSSENSAKAFYVKTMPNGKRIPRPFESFPE